MAKFASKKKEPAPRRRQEREIPAELKKRESKDFRGIVRVAGQDLRGHLTLAAALCKVKGIGYNLAANLTIVARNELGIDAKELVGNFKDEDLEKLEALVKDPAAHGVKPFLLNRQSDPFKGGARHVVGTDLIFARRQDIEKIKRSRTWRGWRHQLGQKVRGQHTRTTGRRGMSVGVLKKAAKQQKSGAAQKAQAASKK
jgi:small subunit ribosomal protein S13